MRPAFVADAAAAANLFLPTARQNSKDRVVSAAVEHNVCTAVPPDRSPWVSASNSSVLMADVSLFLLINNNAQHNPNLANSADSAGMSRISCPNISGGARGRATVAIDVVVIVVGAAIAGAGAVIDGAVIGAAIA